MLQQRRYAEANSIQESPKNGHFTAEAEHENLNTIDIPRDAWL
jgi:hypothetical protein